MVREFGPRATEDGVTIAAGPVHDRAVWTPLVAAMTVGGTAGGRPGRRSEPDHSMRVAIGAAQYR